MGRRDGSVRPSVLAVTSQAPWPLDSGGHLRTYHLLRSLAGRMDVRLVAPAAPESVESCCAALEHAGVAPAVVTVPKRTLAGESVKVLRAAFDQEPYVLFARHRRVPVLETLQIEVASRPPAALYLDHLDSLVYADACPGIPLVIDMHNVYSRLVARVAGESGAFRRRYLERESALLERMERRAVGVAHTVLAVSMEEAQYFQQLGARRAVVVPNGVDCDRFERLPLAQRAAAPTLLFVGSLAWPPNVNAVRFLATEVLPAVRKRIPDARLLVVGRDPGPDVMRLARPESDVEVVGNVEDVAPYYQAAQVLTVPLQAGGGTRLKILEAFAAGVPVVSTPVGCEGIEAIPGSHLAVAELTEFAGAVARLLEQPHKARVLAVRARALAREKYDWQVVGRYAADAVAAAASSAVTSRVLTGLRPTHARRVPAS